jgi:hypothetical protein
MIQLLAVVLLAASVTGCASTKACFVDRGRDAADIFSAAVGVGAGAKARIGPVHVGLAAIHDTVGLRGGEPFAVPILIDSLDPFDFDLLIFGGGAQGQAGFDRFKVFETEGALQCFSKVWASTSPKRPFLHPYYTEVEVAGGLGVTIRVGFNPGELVDFVLGWFGVDVFNDDLEAQERKKSRQVSQVTPHKLTAPKR